MKTLLWKITLFIEPFCLTLTKISISSSTKLTGFEFKFSISWLFVFISFPSSVNSEYASVISFFKLCLSSSSSKSSDKAKLLVLWTVSSAFPSFATIDCFFLSFIAVYIGFISSLAILLFFILKLEV